MLVPVLYNYSFAFGFEKNYEFEYYHSWIRDNWTLSFWCSAVYLVVILGLKRVMEKRKPFDLRVPLILWNAGLAAFSLMGAIRFLPMFIDVVFNSGYYQSVCDTSYKDVNVSGFWTAWFVLMKLPELGDSLFIVLRKRPLMFLHWYHHITVFIYTWYSYMQQTSSGFWFIGMNISVHSIMYTYFMLNAMRIRFPKVISMVITLLQLVQMISGLAVNVAIVYYHSKGYECKTPLINVFFCSLMYFSYAVLFGMFFRQAYLNSEQKKQASKVN